MGRDRPAGRPFQLQAPFRRHPLVPPQDLAHRLGRHPHRGGHRHLALQMFPDDFS